MCVNDNTCVDVIMLYKYLDFTSTLCSVTVKFHVFVLLKFHQIVFFCWQWWLVSINDGNISKLWNIKIAIFVLLLGTLLWKWEFTSDGPQGVNVVALLRCMSLKFIVPRHGEAIGGGDMLGVRPSVTKLVSAISSDFMHRFTRYLTLWCIPP